MRIRELALIINKKYPKMIIDTSRQNSVIPFYTGEQVMDYLPAHQDDYMCAFINYNMLFKSGVEIFEACREFNKTKSLRVLPTIGFSTLAKDKDACIKAGMADFITLPFIDQKVCQVMRNIELLQWAFQGKGSLKTTESCAVM